MRLRLPRQDPGLAAPEEPAAASGREPVFDSFARLRLPAGVTFREAILWSLLAHAIGVIFALLNPPVPAALAARSRRLSADEVPLPMRFVQDRPRAPEPNPDAPAASDRDRRRAQEEASRNATEAEPFSRGNSPMRFAEEPLGAKAPPGPPALPDPVTGRNPGESAGEAADASRGAESFRADAGTGPLLVPPDGARDGEGDEEALREKGRRLRDALDRMGGAPVPGADGGARFRYSNPTGGLATPTGSLSFDTKGFDWGPYARRIYWIIWSNWHDRMPPAVYAGLKGSVGVRFVIHKDGRISDIQILASSGVPAYDSAAVLALEASSPLPPLPDNFPYGSEGVTGRFLYNMWDAE